MKYRGYEVPTLYKDNPNLDQTSPFIICREFIYSTKDGSYDGCVDIECKDCIFQPGVPKEIVYEWVSIVEEIIENEHD